MNFGVRLPGPFRVGVSSKGRVNVGATLGPFSVSTGGGGGKESPSTVVVPRPLDEVEAQLVGEGWVVTYRTPTSITVEHGRQALMAESVRGGVEFRRVHTRRASRFWLVLVVVALVAFFGYGIIDAIV